MGWRLRRSLVKIDEYRNLPKIKDIIVVRLEVSLSSNDDYWLYYIEKNQTP